MGHLNVIKLSQLFGAFKDCKKEAYAFSMKLDQARNKEKISMGIPWGGGEVGANENVNPKQGRNMHFNMQFKDGEPRGRRRKMSIADQLIGM